MKKPSRSKIIFISLFGILTLIFGFLNFIDNEFLRSIVFTPIASIVGLAFLIAIVSIFIPKRDVEEGEEKEK